MSAAVLNDLSKTFVDHDFGFNFKSLKFVNVYLSNKVQATKVSSFYSEILGIILGAPQASILCQLLFNTNIIDIFLIEQYKTDFSKYANDTTPYNCTNTFLEAI